MYLMNRLSVSFLKKLSEGVFSLDDREKKKKKVWGNTHYTWICIRSCNLRNQS